MFINRNRFRLSVECLEQRDMMSVASVTVNAGTLLVKLDNGNDNVQITEYTPPTLVVSQTVAPAAAPSIGAAGTNKLAPAAIAIPTATAGDINNIFTPTITVTDATRANASWTFQRSLVQRIEVDDNGPAGNHGNDTIISHSNLPTTVDLRGGTGTNVVQTGNGNDVVLGGEGVDDVFTLDGNDVILGYGGNDYLSGGRGANVILGGNGDDIILDAQDSASVGSILYGEAGNDYLLAFNRNDAIDGGVGYDYANVNAGTWSVHNFENVFVNVPLGNPVVQSEATAGQAVNRLLGAYGLPSVTQGYIVNDTQYGLTPDRLLTRLQGQKPDATLEYNATSARVAQLIESGKPVIAQYRRDWVVVNSYDQASNTLQFVDYDGVEHSISAQFFGPSAIVY